MSVDLPVNCEGGAIIQAELRYISFRSFSDPHISTDGFMPNITLKQNKGDKSS